MKAVSVHPGSCGVRVIDQDAPVLRTPTDVKLRMLEVGICGTDREIADCQYGTPPDGAEHLVIGHESIGEVVDVGADVRTLRKGDLVVPMVRRPCGVPGCLPCAEGRQDFCSTGAFTERGIKQQHGFMAEYVVDDERWMNKLPVELRDVGVLVEPLTIAEKALAQLAVVQQRLPWACPLPKAGMNGAGAVDGIDGTHGTAAPHGCHKAVVIGAGPVGLLGAMALIHQGFETTVYSRTPEPNDRAALVRALGGRYVSSETHSPEDLAAIVGGIDVVYEAVGVSSVSFDVMRVLGTNGVFIFTGVPARRGPIQLDSDALMRNLVLKNQVVIGSVNAGKTDFEAAIRDLAAFRRRWPEAVRAMITGRFPIDRAESLLKGRAEGIKNVLAIAGADR